jgi:3-hydroxy-9,10-secoandrosta-1,3,5(10)-triene-9,17-dione monooxygenase
MLPPVPVDDEAGIATADSPLVAKAVSLVPLLADHAADRLGRLPDVVVEALHEAGFFSLQAPGVLGGHEADFRTAFEVYRLLGHGGGSSAWTAMILSGGSFVASLYGARARAEVWGADPRAGVASQLVSHGEGRPVEGGLVISGQWRPLSGIHHACAVGDRRRLGCGRPRRGSWGRAGFFTGTRTPTPRWCPVTTS